MKDQELELVINIEEASLTTIKELRNLLKLPFEIFIKFTIKYKFCK